MFEGHDTEVTSLHMNPSDDTFVSIGGHSNLKVFNLAEDHESPIALLDLKEENCQMAANFDSTGVVLAVSVFSREDSEGGTNKNRQRIDLYDVKKYDEGRFDDWRIDEIPRICSIKFSSNGSYFLGGFEGGGVVILDAFKGKRLQIFKPEVLPSPENSLTMESSFSPDSKYVMMGSQDGSVNVYDIEQG